MRQRFAGLLCCILVITGCAQKTTADIRSIDVMTRLCDGCASASALTIDRGSAPALIASFPLDEFRYYQTHAGLVKQSAQLVAIWITYNDGSVEHGIAPGNGEVPAQAQHLSRWVSVSPASFASRADVRRRASIRTAFEEHRVRAVILENRGCFGTCGVYTATFEANGDATLRVRRPCTAESHAAIPFEKITRWFAGIAPWLAASYPIAAEDTLSSRITIVTDDRNFRSDAPDATTWDRHFSVAQARLDQIVRDTSWSPRSCLDAP